ncbi:MAG: hypothetical protein J7K47_06930 [Thermoplasmata archaeon]|nr:hypothetical protein [Thermoplasmata archaeon]
MEKIKMEHFKCIKRDNSPEEHEKQWRRSKIIFDCFHEYLKNKGLKERTASRQTEMVAFFVMDYLFVYDDAMSVLEVDGDTIRRFLGNWYIRKFLNPNMSEIKSFLRAILNFFTFLQENGFISNEQLSEIKEVCKDKAWFEMRLKTYFEAEGDAFYEWLREYDYEF